MLIYSMFGLFVVLSIADGVTTYRALKRPGAREANQVMRWLFERFGTAQALVATKGAAVTAVWLTMGPYSLWVLAGINSLYAVVVWRNYYLAVR